jgi:uncharacterized protein (DUF433 family)
VEATLKNYRYIVRAAATPGNSPQIEGTGIGVHDVINLLQNGETVETLTRNCFPQLTGAQVYECLAYYEDHRSEIDLLAARHLLAAAR